MLIQKLRLKNGWSQQQLATASGLSARTIQRIEAGFPASVESLKSIAGAFEVDFTTLNQEPPMSPNETPSESRRADEAELEAFRHVRELRKFYLHLARYLVIVSGLVVVNLLTAPQYLWVLWVIGGWGVGVALHAFRVFQPDFLLGPKWERQQVEKRLGRSL